MKCLFVALFAFVAASAIVECLPLGFKSYEEARDALDDAISKLHRIANNMPEDENPHDYSSITQTASFLSVLSHTMNEQNYNFLQHSHHYKQALRLIEKYREYL